MKSQQREIRISVNAQVRAKDDGKLGIEGYGAVFNEIYDNGWFKETIKPGAFSRALRESQDVRCLMNHDANLVLGRSKSATLELKEDQKGLHFSCDLPDTQAARDLHQLVKRGDVDQCSFSFRAMAQTWRDEKDADGHWTTTRELTDVDLYDVGPVTFPAYTGTSVGVRSLFPEGVPAEVRSHVPELRKQVGSSADCQCDCPECQTGDCANCSDAECDDPECDHAGQDESNSAREREHMEMRLRLAQAAD